MPRNVHMVFCLVSVNDSWLSSLKYFLVHNIIITKPQENKTKQKKPIFWKVTDFIKTAVITIGLYSTDNLYKEKEM